MKILTMGMKRPFAFQSNIGDYWSTLYSHFVVCHGLNREGPDLYLVTTTWGRFPAIFGQHEG